jgi:hypothetical protein
MIVSLRSGFAACDSAAVLIVTPNAPLSVTLVTISAIAWLAMVREQLLRGRRGGDLGRRAY